MIHTKSMTVPQDAEFDVVAEKLEADVRAHLRDVYPGEVITHVSFEVVCEIQTMTPGDEDAISFANGFDEGIQWKQ
jgi:hypothetical protein